MGRLRCSGIFANLLLIVAMKLISQYTTFEFSFYNSNAFETVNGSCQLRGPNDSFTDNPAMHIMKSGYALSAAGGLAASRFLGFRNVLRIGGGLMTLAIGLMALSIWFGAICSQVFYTLIWLLHPLYMGLLLPCLYFGFIRWTSGDRSRTLLVTLYYLTSSSTIWLNLFALSAIISSKHRNGLALAAVAGLLLSALFTALTTLLKHQPRPRQFQSPTYKRLLRYVIILTAFTLYIVQLGDGHIVQYQKEILQYFNAMNRSVDEQPLRAVRSSNLPRLINQIGVIGASTWLLLMSAVPRIRHVSHELRIQIGVGLAAVAAATCAVANAVFSMPALAPSPTLATAAFSTAALLDGVSEIVTMVSVYEFVDVISTTHKLLIIGVMFSVWSIASLIRYLIVLIVFDGILANAGVGARFRATHIVDLVLLISCFLYTRFLSLPLSFTLMEDQQGETTEEEEETPLLAQAPANVRLNDAPF